MIAWKKWPDEKPPISGWYLIAKSHFGSYEAASMYRIKYYKDTDSWGLDKEFKPEYWAEVNLPCDSEPFIPFVTKNGSD